MHFECISDLSIAHFIKLDAMATTPIAEDRNFAAMVRLIRRFIF